MQRKILRKERENGKKTQSLLIYQAQNKSKAIQNFQEIASIFPPIEENSNQKLLERFGTKISNPLSIHHQILILGHTRSIKEYGIQCNQEL